MPLVKRPEITEKKLAANRRNLQLSHGALTEEGRERIRAAHLRHGFHAPAEGMALQALGEEPSQFQALLEGLWAEFTPTGTLQEGLVIRLARAMWLMNRADRTQEGYALRQAQAVNLAREDRLHVRLMRLKMTAQTLQWLAQSVAEEHYVTTPKDLDMMKNLYQEGVGKEMAEIALALFYQLQAPEKRRIDSEAQIHDVLAKVQGVFGLSTFGREFEAVVTPTDEKGEEASAEDADIEEALGTDDRYPNITADEWQARERARQLLENILNRQVAVCEAHRQATLKESLAGPSPYERAAEIAPLHPDASRLRRMQDSHFREVRRVTSLLLKMKGHERRRERSDDRDEDDEKQS